MKLQPIFLTALLLACGRLAQAQPAAPPAAPQPLPFTGVSIAGGEFATPLPNKKPVYGKDYVYPNPAELAYFAGKGVNVIRFPFHWMDLQPALNTRLDPVVLGRIQRVVAAAAARKQIVLLDPHDYARYYGKVIGTPDVPEAAFADFWGRLAAAFKNNPHVWFGLMNEPYDMPNEQWLGAANAAAAAIRKTGATNLILVPGNSWTGAHSWIGSGNAKTMLGFRDPKNHFFWEVHQYFDSDSSGMHPEAVSTTIGRERLEAFTLWCRQRGQRAFLGEFSAANNPTALAAADDMLRYMEANRDVWVGHAWWAAGSIWGTADMGVIEPKDGKDRPQMAMLRPHLQK